MQRLVNSTAHVLLLVTVFTLTTKAPLRGKGLEVEPLSFEMVLNAPVEKVWELYTTAAGMQKWMASKASIDLKIGGEIRTSYDPESTLDDEKTIVQEILTFEPLRLLSVRLVQAPSNSPFAEASKGTWANYYFESLGPHTTRFRMVGLGYRDTEESRQMREYFVKNNPKLLQEVRRLVEPSPDTRRKALALLQKLRGGYWIHDAGPEGGGLKIRNSAQIGPDGQSVLIQSWMNQSTGWYLQTNSMYYRLSEADGEGVGFLSIDEMGSVSQGRISLSAPNTVSIDWPQRALNGRLIRFRIEMVFDGDDAYLMKPALLNELGGYTDYPTVQFRRVETLPVGF